LILKKNNENSERSKGGTLLPKLLLFYPGLFSSFYINMIKSGRSVGKLSEVFMYLADYLEKQQNFQSKIKGAMVYPIFV